MRNFGYGGAKMIDFLLIFGAMHPPTTTNHAGHIVHDVQRLAAALTPSMAPVVLQVGVVDERPHRRPHRGEKGTVCPLFGARYVASI